jgi:hypothetical protein
VTGDAATCTKRTCEYGSFYKLFWLMDAVLELVSHYVDCYVYREILVAGTCLVP